MAVTPGLCVSARLDLVTGVHQPGDNYKIALYAPSANLTPLITHYTKENEVKGKGYVAGGAVLQGYMAYLEGLRAYVCWEKGVIWKNASITARGAVVYNASKGDKALLVLDVMDEMGNAVTSTNGNFSMEAGIAFWIG